MNEYHLTTPLKNADIEKLNAGDVVYLSNKILTARDAAHLRLKSYYHNSIKFEEEMEGYAIFHAGPIVNIDEQGKYTIRAIGPTTSLRMERYSDIVGKLGIKAIIGKGGMGNLTTNAMKEHKMVYLVAAHGCASVHTNKVKGINKQYWMDELGMPEAIWVMEFNELGPLIVGIDSKGRNVFEEIKEKTKQRVEDLYPLLDKDIS